MNDRLARLIREADAAAGPIRPPPAGLADRVRRKAVRRTRTRATLGVFAVLLLIVLGGSWPWGAARDASTVASCGEGPVPGKVAPKVPDSTALRAELGRLASEIRTREAVVEVLLSCEKNRDRLAALRRELDRPDPLSELQAQIASAANVALQSAERRCVSTATTACAAAYKRIVDLFPQTPAAGTARQRLKEMEDPNGGVS